MPKILYIVQKYDYGIRELGFSFEHYNFYNTLINMNNASNKVIYFPFDEISQRIGRDQTNKRLLEIVDKEKPDLCFFSIFEDEYKKEIIKEITQKGAITFNWFTDDRWRVDNFSKYWAPCFRWISTTEKSALNKYRKLGYKNIIKTQFGCNHFLYKPLSLPKIYDVTFVGQPHGNRKNIIKKIKKAGINVECWGRGWPNGRISQEKMIQIFSQSKINLNFARCSSKISLKSIAGIFLNRGKNKSIKTIRINNPKKWINNLKSFLEKQKNQIKGRNFEIPGCAGFFLTDHADNLEDYYEIGKEIICWKNSNDLIDKIRYYLENEKEREAIARAGYERTLRDHTYEKRFNEIFKIIGLIK